MNKITQKLSLDLAEVSHHVINARQNDRLTRDLYITITNNGSEYGELPETAFAYLRGRRTDGKPVFYNVEISDRKTGLLHAELHNYVLCCPGRCKLDIAIYNRLQDENEIQKENKAPCQEEEIASTDSFILYIPEEVFDEVEVVESDEGSTLSQLINTARDEIDEMNSLERQVTDHETQREAKEAIREANENTRKVQEAKRQEDTNSAIENTNAAAQSASTAATAANSAAESANSAATNADSKAADLQNKLDSHYFALMEDLQSHNSSGSSHDDIRSLVSGLNTRLNALADSDDTTLDQLSEIVTYIKNNKSLIDNITTSKVNVADIVDNLTSTSANKPLSAKQGKVLKDLMDALTTVVGNKVDKVVGKGLSTNDYTTTEKNKLSGIAQGAEVNVQADWNVTDATSDAYIKNKPAIPTVGNGTITIKQAGTPKGTFTMNQSGNTTIELTDSDTNTWRGIQNNLTSDSTTDSLAAKQGKILKAEIDDLKNSVSDGKTLVANAITGKGVTTATDAAFQTIANNIGKIATLTAGTADATASASNILSGKTAYVNGTKVSGTMPNQGAKSAALNCGGSYTIPAGYHNGSGKVTANSLSSQITASAFANKYANTYKYLADAPVDVTNANCAYDGDRRIFLFGGPLGTKVYYYDILANTWTLCQNVISGSVSYNQGVGKGGTIYYIYSASYIPHLGTFNLLSGLAGLSYDVPGKVYDGSLADCGYIALFGSKSDTNAKYVYSFDGDDGTWTMRCSTYPISCSREKRVNVRSGGEIAIESNGQLVGTRHPSYNPSTSDTGVISYIGGTVYGTTIRIIGSLFGLLAVQYTNQLILKDTKTDVSTSIWPDHFPYTKAVCAVGDDLYYFGSSKSGMEKKATVVHTELFTSKLYND